MAPTARLPPKKDVALALLEQASLYIHLDPRAEAVQVPAWFKKQPQLVLQVGLNMAVPIPDLHVDDQGLSCTLSFNRSPFFCLIPWRAVFALVGENGQAMVWAEDVPAEVAAQAQAQKAPEKPRTHLRSVADAESATPAAAAPKAVEPKVEKKKAAGKAATAKPSAAEPAPTAAAKRSAKPSTTKVLAAKPATAKKPAAAKPAAAKLAAAKPAAHKAPAAKKATPQRPAAKKPTPQPALAKQPATQKPAIAARQAAKPMAARSTTEGGKPKRELPPYLRVVK